MSKGDMPLLRDLMHLNTVINRGQQGFAKRAHILACMSSWSRHLPQRCILMVDATTKRTPRAMCTMAVIKMNI